MFSVTLYRAAVSGEQTREAELLKNHMNDLEELTKLKADKEDLHKEQEHLRYGDARWKSIFKSKRTGRIPSIG